MGDWSTMPEELLQEISERLSTWSDVILFRSVCSSWRSASRYRRRPLLPPRFRILLPPLYDYSGIQYFLGRRTIYLLSLPHCDRSQADPLRRGSSWLISFDDVPSALSLRSRLFGDHFGPLPKNFPKLLDTSKIRVSELTSEYLIYRGTITPPLKPVVFTRLNSTECVVLAIDWNGGKLTACRSSENIWRVFSAKPGPFHDLILFKDKFYAVDRRGWMVNVGFDFSFTEVARPVFGGKYKFLVESLGELLLADLSVNFNADSEGPASRVTFKIYRLDSKEQKWVEIYDLGDRVLFLGDDLRFSASSSDLNSCKGNCIIFSGYVDYAYGNDGAINLSVFDMASGRVGSLDDYTGYSELFWPPPEWIMSSATSEVVEDQLASLA